MAAELPPSALAPGEQPETWRSLRKGTRRAWEYRDVRGAAQSILQALPDVALKLFREGSFAGQPVVNLQNVLSTPTASDVRRNFLWLRCVAGLFPDTCPTTFFYADVFVELNKLMGGALLRPKAACSARSAKCRAGASGDTQGGGRNCEHGFVAMSAHPPVLRRRALCICECRTSVRDPPSPPPLPAPRRAPSIEVHRPPTRSPRGPLLQASTETVQSLALLEGEKLHKVHSHLRRLSRQAVHGSHDAKLDELKALVVHANTRRTSFRPGSSSPSAEKLGEEDSDEKPLVPAAAGPQAAGSAAAAPAAPAGALAPPALADAGSPGSVAPAQPGLAGAGSAASAPPQAGEGHGLDEAEDEDAVGALRSFRKVCEQLQLDPGSDDEDEDVDVTQAVRRVLQRIPEPVRPMYARQIFDLLEESTRAPVAQTPCRPSLHQLAEPPLPAPITLPRPAPPPRASPCTSPYLPLPRALPGSGGTGCAGHTRRRRACAQEASGGGDGRAGGGRRA